MGKDVIIACDFAGREETMRFLGRFGEEKPFLKIGMELFYAAGPDMVREIKSLGYRVFLDLKLHDIPNTVKKAMAVLSELRVDMCNLHAAGTRAMMEAALEAGAEDFVSDGDVFTIYTEPDDLYGIKEDLEKAGYAIASAEKTKLPSTWTTLDADEDRKFMGLLVEKLEDDDDVMDVFHNWENSDEE